ncbi:MAG: hypothetical protein KBC62_00015 [Candidatus Pacebacteria bacterium]|nr:hypothetical protein [Candidatus Paceibacterota bacterium]MBP9842375.1 hypothetical protein [Candidatus Paceibacterota bacterium]
MLRFSFIKNTLLVAVIASVFSVNIAMAAKVNFDVVSNPDLSDTATIIEVRIDPEGKRMNALEGALLLKSAEDGVISSVITETGGSVFSLWPVSPRYDDKEKVIQFNGGVPQGFLEESPLFRMRVFTTKPSQISVAWIGGSAYLDDGQGTFEPVTSRSITVATPKSIPNLINSASDDSEPPVFDTVEITSDPDVFDGKYFVSFHANDNLSGIDRYEVTEDQVVTEVEDGTYVFRNQEMKEPVLITAYDKAGNSTAIKVPQKYKYTNYLVGLIIVLATFIAFWFRKKLVGIFRK